MANDWRRFGDEWPPSDRDVLVKDDEGNTEVWKAGEFIIGLGRDEIAFMVDDEPYGFDDYLWKDV